MLGAPLRGKISGSDLLPALCTVAAKKNYRIFFLGGNKDSASIAAQKLREINKSVKIVGTLSPVFGFEKIDLEVNKIIGEINKLNPEILFVGLGCPKQEKFIDDHRDRLNALLIAGVRASFEFASGAIRRSPQWMQDCALEWLYRLIKEPGRLLKRYLVSNTYFIFLFTKKYLQMIFRIDKKQ
jgi:exopolysaccharide biosynthesis WecB/TagA/CpsF family protein